MLEDILAAEYRDLPPEQIEQIVESTLGDAAYPEDLENFSKTLQSVGAAVSKALPQVLPVAGTVIGTAFGGPAGGALGGALGSAAGGAISGPRPPTGAPPPAQQPPQMTPAAPSSMPSGSPATAQLLQAMFHPQMLQALMAMCMGQAGRRNIPVGDMPVPPGAFTNLLNVLTTRAAAEYNAVAPNGESPRYFYNYTGEAMGDPAVDEHRAEALWERLQEAGVEQRRPSTGGSRRLRYHEEEWELDEQELDEEFYDWLEIAELDGGYAP